jgi:hypothetical protein
MAEFAIVWQHETDVVKSMTGRTSGAGKSYFDKNEDEDSWLIYTQIYTLEGQGTSPG